MKIPSYENKVSTAVQTQINPTRYQPAQIQLDTGLSGSSYDTAAAKLGNTVFDIAEKVGEHLTRMKQQDNEKEVMETEISYQQELNQMMSNSDMVEVADSKDPTKKNLVPSGYLVRNGDQAQNIYQDFRPKASELSKKYLDSTANDWQREKLRGVFAKYEQEYGSRVLSHQAQQREQAYKTTTAASVELGISQVSAFAGDKNKQLDLLVSGENSIFSKIQTMSKWGTPQEAIELAKNKAAYQSASNILEATGATNTSGVEHLKKYISPDDWTKIKSTMKGKEEGVAVQSLWLGIRNSKNVKDQNFYQVKEDIYSNKAMSLEQKGKAWSGVEALMKEQGQQEISFRTQRDKQLVNDVMEGRKAGLSLSQLQAKYSVGTDMYGQRDSETQINLNIKTINELHDTYATAYDKVVLDQLTKDSHAGVSGTHVAVEKAALAGKISSKQKRELIENISKGGSPSYKAIDTTVENIIIGAGYKEKTPEFYEAKDQINNMSSGNPDLMIESANKLFSKNANSGAWFQKTYFQQLLKQKESAVESAAKTINPAVKDPEDAAIIKKLENNKIPVNAKNIQHAKQINYLNK